MDTTTARRSVAVLGMGTMGSAMARRLLGAGFATTVWDRSPGALEGLVSDGARAAASPADALRGASVVITMLPTLDVVRAVVLAPDVTAAFEPGAHWAQMGTIGVPETMSLADELAGRRPDVVFVDAPVSGSKGPAEQGQLVILASGPTEAAAVLDPVFDVLGHKTVWVGDAGRGSALKLVVNTYLAVLIEGVAEALAVADHLGLDHGALDEAIGAGPLASPAAMAKLKKMEDGEYSTEFALRWALKDVDLTLEAAGDARLPLVTALSAQWHEAVDRGLGDRDLSAARLALGAGASAG
ncbi:MAG TPA: NAD(P)-dependent oxidoreductase [Acidimicrobiales bacterium]|nr:NAD(P)-dependent oxidoreductase [Acidimicrobiales bacterium]